MRVVFSLLLALAVVGCPTSRRVPDDGSTDVGPRDSRTDTAVDSDVPPLVPADELDLLFVMENAGGLSEEQSSFAMQLPRLFAELVALYDSVQVGVVTSDMGTGGFRVPTCAEPDFGDDGVLVTSGNTAIPGCAATYPSFLAFTPATDDPSAFASDVTCIAMVGTSGCGFEQHLESMLKAVTPSSAEPTGRFDGAFVMGTVGHGDRANAGFARPNADLAIVVMGEEDDCSYLDPELFNPGSSVYSGDLNLRCFAFPAAVQPVERYADGLLVGRDPRRVHLMVMGGVPTTAAGDDFDAILGHPDMQERIDPDNPTRLVPSCNVAGRGFAFPPRRMVQLARQLDARGARASAQSVCQADFTPLFDALIALLR